MSLKNEFLKNFLLAYLWGIGLIVFSIIIFYFSNNSFKWINFLQFDAVHYYKIAFIGYNHKRSAFFPLFPFIWHLIGNSMSLILIVNNIFFSLSFAILNAMFSWNYYQKILFLSIPSGIFFYLPYSESIFALACSILLYFMFQNNQWGIILTFFFLSFIRPSVTILLPALAIYLFFENYTILSKIIIIFSCTLLSILAFWVVNMYQYSYTNIPWGFFSAQSTYWDNHWRIPTFPLWTYGDNLILGLDLFSFWAACWSFYLLIINFLKKIRAQNLLFPPIWIFVYSYILGSTLLVLLTRGGSLFSLNRFIFATIFGGLFVNHFSLNFLLHNKKILMGLIMVVSFINKPWINIKHFLTIVTTFLPILLIYLQSYKLIRILLILLFVTLQIILIQKFMSGIWVA